LPRGSKAVEKTEDSEKVEGEAAAETTDNLVPAKLNELGEIIAMDSGNPTISLGSLQLQGKRVYTSSKFLVLTLQPNKKRVLCKHIFDSVLVFENAQQSADHVEQPVSTEMPHYGGSSRGDPHEGATQKVEYLRMDLQYPPPALKAPPAASKGSQDSDNDDSRSSDEKILLEDDLDDPDEFRIKNFSQDSVAPQRLGSRGSEKKSVKYSEVETEQESASTSGDDEEEDKKPRAKRKRQSTAPAVTQESDEESDHVVVVKATKTKPARQPRKSTANLAKLKGRKENVSGDEDEVSSDSDEDQHDDDEDFENDGVVVVDAYKSHLFRPRFSILLDAHSFSFYQLFANTLSLGLKYRV
jgi:hypothetical protein